MKDVIKYTHFGREIELPICEVKRFEKKHNDFGSSLHLTYADGTELNASGNHDFIEVLYTTAVAISNSYVLGYKHGYGKATEDELCHLRKWSR